LKPRLVCAGVAAGLLHASIGFAQTAAPASGPTVKVGVMIFADHTTTIEPKATDANHHTYTPDSFNIARSYISVTGTMNPILSFRVTTDIARDTDTSSALSGNYVARLKYAYGQVTLDKWTGKFTQTWLRFGLTSTPFVEGRESVYRYRFQGSLMPEREGLISSSDSGVTFHTSFPSNHGDLQLSVLNGEGYQKAEANNQKAYQGRISVRPVPGRAPEWAHGLRLNLFYDRDHYMFDVDKTRLIAGATFEHKHFNMGADLVRSRDELTPVTPVAEGRGWSVFVTPFFKAKGRGPEALLRIDRMTPDRLKSEQRRREIAGLAWWWTPSGAGSAVALMLDYEQTIVAHQITLQPDQKKLTLHALLTF
jgi:hypothetical protein